MNAEVILNLLTDLYMQVTVSQQRIAELERELAEARAAAPPNGRPAEGQPAPGSAERVAD